jgi:hypothetical protein
VRSILDGANREFGAHFDVERSARDTLRYRYEDVRAAVANVLLKRTRGYRFENPGAVLWDGITLEGYRLEEFSVARFEEVLRLCEPSVDKPPPVPIPGGGGGAVKAQPATTHGTFAAERRRREGMNAVYESLAPEVRRRLDDRARALAEGELRARRAEGTGELDPVLVGLRTTDQRNNLLESEHKAEIAAFLKTC